MPQGLHEAVEVLVRLVEPLVHVVVSLMRFSMTPKPLVLVFFGASSATPLLVLLFAATTCCRDATLKLAVRKVL